MSSIRWNPKVKLVLSDVDETVADLYVPAEREMISELGNLLKEGISLFFITGQSVKSVSWRITDHLPEELKKNILISHCSGAEVWGFDDKGNLLLKPFYSLYDNALNEEQKNKWRAIINQLISEFKLKPFETMPVNDFKEKTSGDPLAIMMEDRGPQITFEVVNGFDLEPEMAEKMEMNVPLTHGTYDIRIPIFERAEELFNESGIPITPRLGGVFAIDFAIKGVSKETSVRSALNDNKVLEHLGLEEEILKDAENIEIWGDKFSVIRGGTDRHMSEAVDPKVRSLDFREENPEEFLKGYNIVVWDGNHHLHEGLLEYLKSKSAT